MENEQDLNIQHLLEKYGLEKSLEILVNQLSWSDFNSFMLEVFRQKSQQISPAQLLQNYLSNRFVAPAKIPVIDFLNFELEILKLADLQGFSPIELSPLSPIGTCSVVATANQNKIVSALRSTEVTADATNLLALECTKQRKAQNFPNKILQFASIHRHVRTQIFDFKGFSPHFKILTLVSAGKDTGNFEFEAEQIYQHILFYYQYFTEKLQIPQVRVHLKYWNSANQTNSLAETVHQYLKTKMPNLDIQKSDNQQVDNKYYQQLQFKFIVKYGEEEFEIGDGGLVDWTQKLSSNRKERYLISGLGIEVMFKLIHKLI